MADGTWRNDGIIVGGLCKAECTSNSTCGECRDATLRCNAGKWGACEGGSRLTDYYTDADNDGWCTSNYVTRCPAEQPANTRTRPGCNVPGFGIPTDCFDGNGFANQSCCERITHGPNYSKVCCGGAETNGWFQFDCGVGWHLAYCDTRRISGASKYFLIEPANCPIGQQSGWIGVYYALDFLEGVTGHGVAHCVPDGMISQAPSCPNPADL